MLMSAKQRSPTARLGSMIRTRDQCFGRLDGKKVDGKNIDHKRAEVDDEAAAGEADDDIDDATERNSAFCNDRSEE